MKILKNVQKVPGGLMVVPLLIGATLNTLCPSALEIGGFTTALFKDSSTALIALFCLCNAAQINVKQAGSTLGKGVALTAVKFAIGAIIGIVVGKVFGTAGILGLTPLAIVASLTNSNGGLYAALAGQYGDASDVGAISILSLNDGPFFTMVALGAAGIANIPFMSLVACIVPIVLGFILGNLDEDLRELLGKGTVLPIPFFAFSLGTGLNWTQIVEAGLPGIVLGVACTLLTGIGGYITFKIMRTKNPAVGAAVGTTAGNAVGTPEALALADPSLSGVVAVSTVQIAAAIIVTAICCPLLVSFLDKKEKAKAA
ncbi:MAG TPA: 2-keto-3-deoxygluconate permease [Candidatus Blautia gallistercoris]|uniref:2-keto-3-deoxygluconate permease n=1 Tax=Candidatus Blautia gallistercoris TaxID=2838490 RepID=A0A9D1WI95_9FIRM|nr:2-keto-3-deoxygluconate permease [Candidatus Blautia gallistercoris]